MEKQIKTEEVFRREERITDLTTGDHTENEYLFSRNEYDEKGNRVRQESFNSEGVLMEKYCYTFDEKSRMIGEKVYYTEDEVVEETHFEYLENGKLKSEIRTYQDGSCDTVSWEYDQNQEWVKKVCLDEDKELEFEEKRNPEKANEWREKYNYMGELEEKESWRRDENGNVVFYEKIISDDEYICLESLFDENNRRKEVKTFDRKGRLVKTEEMEYNDEGKLSVVNENDGGNILVTNIDYDDNGEAVKQETIDANDNIVQSLIRVYNDDGLLESSEVYIDNQGLAPNRHYYLRTVYSFH